MGNSCLEGVRQSGVGITSLTWRRPSLEHQQCLRYVQSCPLPVDPSWWSTTSPRLTMAPPWAAQLTFWSWSWVALANVILARTVSVQVSKCPVSSSWFSQVALPAAAWAGIDQKEVFKSVSVVLVSVLFKIQFDSQTQWTQWLTPFAWVFNPNM